LSAPVPPRGYPAGDKRLGNGRCKARLAKGLRHAYAMVWRESPVVAGQQCGEVPSGVASPHESRTMGSQPLYAWPPSLTSPIPRIQTGDLIGGGTAGKVKRDRRYGNRQRLCKFSDSEPPAVRNSGWRFSRTPYGVTTNGPAARRPDAPVFPRRAAESDRRSLSSWRSIARWWRRRAQVHPGRRAKCSSGRRSPDSR
jgi:hypothetical protein